MVTPPARQVNKGPKKTVENSSYKKGRLSQVISEDRKFLIVQKKLIEPPIEEAPAICILKIPKSTPILWCPIKLDKSGYKIHPILTPVSTSLLKISNLILGGRSHKDKLFNRGKAISAHPNIKGSNQLPNPPIRTGISKKI